MSTDRYRHRRTLGSGPPSDLLFGEIAYSDADQTLYIGRPNGPPVALRIGGLHTVRAVGNGVRVNYLGVRQ